jgi:hypothetical protein
VRHRLEALRRENRRWARRRWFGLFEKASLKALDHLSSEFELSILGGDLIFLNGAWYVTNAGLLRLARRNHCSAIEVQPLRDFCQVGASRWVFKATVYKTAVSKGFVGYGDADPSNVSALVHGAEMRVAETRAVNRALRKAYGIGLCSVEELGWEPKAYGQSDPHRPAAAANNNGHQNGHTRLRDRLCLLIRQHKLDANLVKAYAADYCGTPNLRDATREQIESFIASLSEWATKDRAGVVCKLNGYSKAREVTS